MADPVRDWAESIAAVALALLQEIRYVPEVSSQKELDCLTRQALSILYANLWHFK